MKLIIIGFFIISFLAGCNATTNDNEINKVYVDGVKDSNISLNGKWKIAMNPPSEFWKNEINPITWDDIEVPGELLAQGFLIKMDEPFAYKKQITIPKDFSGNRILLHFEGVNNLAKVWINGEYVMSHQGGFTAWDCDITEYVKPGTSAWLTMEVTNISREISFNGKAQRPTGGIPRAVELRARPVTFMPHLIISSPFDDTFTNAKLQISGYVTMPSKEARATFKLFNPSGKNVKLPSNNILLDKDVVSFSVPVNNPVKWDAEHPNLYRLQVTIESPGKSKATYSKYIGFRDIRFDENNNLLINGQITKLRGANRHLSNPTGGKMPTREYEELDTKLAKEANLNFFRTSHYPQGEGLLEQCDKLGMYVTVESAVVDAGKPNRPSKGMHNDTNETKHFLSQLREMILTHGSHPSVILWSTANESMYGLNFLESYKLCKRMDMSRPVIASYQMSRDKKHESFDVYSNHYPKWNQNFSDVNIPTVYDEWMHVLGHSAEQWFHDPNGRDYWGRSLDKAWNNLFPTTTGSIGGAIWNYIDDVTYYPNPTGPAPEGRTSLSRFNSESLHMYIDEPKGNVFGVARWGIIDEWRRKKPEFWNTKKAYSPIRLLDKRIENFTPNKPVKLMVYNRFDHTNLDEISVKITYAGQSKTERCNALLPREKGSLTIPAFNWNANTDFKLEFFDEYNNLIDIYTIALGKEKAPDIIHPKGKVKIEETIEQIKFIGEGCQYNINPKTGLFTSFVFNRKKIPVEGPFMHIYSSHDGMEAKWVYDSPHPSHWKMENVKIDTLAENLKVVVAGKMEEIAVNYTYTIGANGRLDIDYSFKNIPLTEQTRLGQTIEAGIKFRVGEGFDELEWDRKGYWSYYPKDHISSLAGKVPLFIEEKPEYRKQPNYPWRMDVHDWYYQGVSVMDGKLIPRVAQGAKLGVYRYSLINRDKAKFTVLGDGRNTSARFNRAKDKDYYVYILNVYNPNLRWGNYRADYPNKAEHEGKVMLMVD